jgi:hypothetical protein
MHALPTLADDGVDLPYQTPALLQKAGVLFAINDEDDAESIKHYEERVKEREQAFQDLIASKADMMASNARILAEDMNFGSEKINKE